MRSTTPRASASAHCLRRQTSSCELASCDVEADLLPEAISLGHPLLHGWRPKQSLTADDKWASAAREGRRWPSGALRSTLRRTSLLGRLRFDHLGEADR